MGAYAELIDNNGAFAEFVRTYASMEEEEEETGIILKLCLCVIKLLSIKIPYRSASVHRKYRGFTRSTSFSRKFVRETDLMVDIYMI